MLLRPSAELNATLLGALGRAQRRFGLEIVAVTALSNHLHLLVLPENAEQLANTMEYFLSKLAREVGRLHDWRDKFWSRRYRAIPISEEPAVQVERLRYLLENGTKEHLVEHPRDWPGVHSVAALVDGEELAGVWVDRTSEYRALRRRAVSLPGQHQQREVVHLTPLPCWAHLSETERRRLVAELVDDIAAVAPVGRGRRPVLGRQRILRQAPHQRPDSFECSPAPAVHAASKAIRVAMGAAYRAFLDLYRQAARRLKKGDRLVEFPAGCFPPPLPVPSWAPS